MPGKINILHVDDSRAILLYIKTMLMEISSIRTIESAHTVAEAKTALAAKDTDVVILDINLPDGNGIDLLGWIKKNYPSRKVIMFTNSSDAMFRKAAEKAGADHFFDKSMEFEDLIKMLRSIKLNHTPAHETKR